MDQEKSEKAICRKLVVGAVRVKRAVLEDPKLGQLRHYREEAGESVHELIV